MINLYVAKFEVTPKEEPQVTFRIGDTVKNSQEFKIRVPTYAMKVWAEAVGCHIQLDPQVMANLDCCWLTDKQGDS